MTDRTFHRQIQPAGTTTRSGTKNFLPPVIPSRMGDISSQVFNGRENYRFPAYDRSMSHVRIPADAPRRHRVNADVYPKPAGKEQSQSLVNRVIRPSSRGPPLETNGPLATGFWLENPSSLFQSFELFPHSEMTDAQRLNAMTRVIILMAAIMFVVKFQGWLTFLIIGMIVVIILWYIMKNRSDIRR